MYKKRRWFTYKRYSPSQLSSMWPWDKAKAVALPVPSTTWLSPDKTRWHALTTAFSLSLSHKQQETMTDKPLKAGLSPPHRATTSDAGLNSVELLPGQLGCIDGSTQPHPAPLSSFQLSSALLGLRLTSAALFPAAASSTASQLSVPESSLGGKGRDRADPNNLPRGERQKCCMFRGAQPFFSLKPHLQ